MNHSTKSPSIFNNSSSSSFSPVNNTNTTTKTNKKRRKNKHISQNKKKNVNNNNNNNSGQQERPPPSMSVGRTMAKLRKVLNKGRMRVQYMFTKMDKDESGSLDINEIRVGLKEVIGIDLTEKELSDVMAYIDEDNDGSITFKELDQGLRDSDTARKDAIELRKKGRPSGGIGYTLSNETLEKRIGIASDIVFQRKGRANFKDTEIQKVRESVDSFLRKPTMF